MPNIIMPALSAGPYSLVLKHSMLADGGWIDDLAWDTGPGTRTRDRAIVQVADSIDRSSTRRVACARRRRASSAVASTTTTSTSSRWTPGVVFYGSLVDATRTR